MQNFIKASSTKSPKVNMDAQKGRIEFKGSSIMENSRAFYEPVIAWLNEYAKTPKNTLVHIELEYFNSSSAKAFLSILKAVSKIKEEGFELTIEWYYTKEDEDQKESGMNYASVIDADFKFIEKHH
jgi:hypothetical protein